MYPKFFWRQPVLNSYELCIMSKLLEMRTQFYVDGNMLSLYHSFISSFIFLSLFIFSSLFLSGVFSHLFQLFGSFFFLRLVGACSASQPKQLKSTEKNYTSGSNVEWNKNKNKTINVIVYQCMILLWYRRVLWVWCVDKFWRA